LIGVDESLVIGRIDRIPRIAGHDPTLGRLVFEGVEIFGLAGQKADHGAVFEGAARGAFTHQLGEVTRVWVVLLWGVFESRAEDAAPIRMALDESFTQVAGRQFGPSLEAHLYERKSD